MPNINMTQPAMGTHVFPIQNPLLPPSPSHPPGLSQCTSPEHAVSCIKPGLAIHFTYENIHVSMLPSQIIPPLPSPTESKRLSFPSVSLLVSHMWCHHYHLSIFFIYFYYPYICVSILYWWFSFCLTSLCIMGSSFIQLIRTDSNVFFLMAK